ncbi:MAG: DNA-binding protein [Chthoniobacterales bacterium]|nr:MAG: DNA-binding protein [Chthoniobacterales bacterium]
MRRKQIARFSEPASYTIRAQRVMLDSDLAASYGTSTMRLNEQFRRNRKRFPEGFAFVFSVQEFTNLGSQNAISRSHGGRRKPPVVFTEHGAIMLASVLSSDVAIDVSVRVVRAFVKLREMVSSNVQLVTKLADLERRLDSHDEAIAQLFAAIRELLQPATPEKEREVGFHVQESEARYRIQRKRAA